MTALVSGSDLYEIEVTIKPLPKTRWTTFKAQCGGQIGTLLDLLQGKVSESVIKRITDQGEGLFPSPKEIRLSCSCPDWATMCKHVAATLYGVGARLDDSPELFFLLRGLDHQELIESAGMESFDVSLPQDEDVLEPLRRMEPLRSSGVPGHRNNSARIALRSGEVDFIQTCVMMSPDPALQPTSRRSYE